MSTSQVLEVAIGLIFVYYVLGSIISFVTRLLLDAAETRGVTLEQNLKRIAGDKTVDLTNLPQLKALRPIRFKSWWGVLGAQTEVKKLEKVPVGTLVDAFFDMTGLTGRPNVNADELIGLIQKFPESESKQAMLKWVDQGITDVNQLRNRTRDYFGGVLNQAADSFKSNARSMVIILSIVLVFALGADTIQIAVDLWNNAELRAVAAAKASMIAGQDGELTDINQIVQSLGETNIRIAWWQLSTTFPAKSGTPWWQFILYKVVGLSISAAAVSQGSSFWYDLMKKVTAAPSSSSSTSTSSGGGSTSTSSSESS